MRTIGWLLALSALGATTGCTQPIVPHESLRVSEPLTMSDLVWVPEWEGASVVVDGAQAMVEYPDVPTDPPTAGRVLLAADGTFAYQVSAVTTTSDTTFLATLAPAEITDILTDGALTFDIGGAPDDWQPGVDVQPLGSDSWTQLLRSIFTGPDAPCTISSPDALAVEAEVHTSPRFEGEMHFAGSHFYGQANVNGDLDIDVRMTFQPGHVRLSCHGDLDEWLRTRIERRVPLTRADTIEAQVRFLGQLRAIWIPWTFTVEPVLAWTFEVDADLGRLVLHFHSTSHYFVGAVRSIDDADWSVQQNPIIQAEGSPSIDIESARGPRARLSATMSPGVRATLTVFGLFSPSATVRAVLAGSAETNVCGWQVHGSAALTFNARLRVGVTALHHDFELPEPRVLWSTGMPDGVPDFDRHGSYGTCEPQDPCFQPAPCGECIHMPGCIYCPDGGCMPEGTQELCAPGARLTDAQCAECTPLGYTCETATDCCSADASPSVTCVDQKCVDTSMCLNTGELCDSVSPCCSESRICEHLLGDTTNLRCCGFAQARCSVDADCCGYMNCSSGTCVPRAEGQSCMSFWECGAGLGCIEGACRYGA